MELKHQNILPIGCDFQISNMAPSTGRIIRKYSAVSPLFILCLFVFAPYVRCMRLGTSRHGLCLPHNINKGFIVTKILTDPECVEVNRVSKSSEKVITPFHVGKNGYLVTNLSLADRLEDVYTVKAKSLYHCSNTPITPVSDSNQIYIEIVGVGDSLSFIHDKYTGVVFKNAEEGSPVQGITDLSACAIQNCHDITYSMKGKHAEHFRLRTLNQHGRQTVQILTKSSLRTAQEQSFNFIITAKDSTGLQGHTNVEITLLEYENTIQLPIFSNDQNLRFHEHTLHNRQKRQTPEIFPDQNFTETKTGVLFSVAPNPPNTDWRYSLKVSTPENMFQVDAVTGEVSLAAGVKLDYEDVNKRAARIVITVTRNDVGKFFNP